MNAATATDTQKTAINALNTAMDAELSRALQLAGAMSGYDQALLTMNTTLKKNNGTLSQHTQAGITDRQSIEAVVGSLQSQRDAQIKNGATVAAATAKYQTNSAALLAQVGRLNGTKSAAYAYMKQLLAIPKSVKTIIDANKNPAEAKVAAITARMNAIRQGKVPGITANTAAGQAAIAALQRQIDVLHGKAVTIQVQTFTTRTNTLINRTSNVGPVKQANGGILNAFANGGIRAFANGNILNTGIRAFANGGESHVAQIAPAGAMRLWAEPETGGEAYIPLAPSKRARSTAIWEETGRRLGASAPGMTGPIELGPNTIRALVRALATRPMILDGNQIALAADRRLMP
ncbi:MAG: hypothetical protein H7338_04185 [Candidatus Sericytochromatia bacterium]|nr:hypothetical protein [Candidatus Sericytochromatia bacterium]